MSMRVLVTGGTGMLGQAFIRKYAGDVRIKFIGRNLAKGQQIERATSARFHQVDLLDRLKLLQVCQNVDAVIHCAALSSPWGSQSAFEQANVLGTQNLLQACKANHVKKLVHISTPSVYFQFKDGQQIKETQEIGPTYCNYYATSKAKAEILVQASNIDTVILRPRGIFGPEDQAIIPRILQSIKKDQFIAPSQRNPWVDLTYVDNVAQASMLALQWQGASGEIFNISNGEPVKILDVLTTLFCQLQMKVHMKTLPYSLLSPLIRGLEFGHRHWPGMPEPNLTRYTQGLFHFHQTLDISKAKSLLGYQPEVTMTEGIHQYVKWYQSQSF